MIRRRSFLAAGVLLGLLAVSIGARGAENVGGLFSLGTSARGQGLGGAFSALVDDESAVFHNPAALGWYDGLGLSSLLALQFGGVTYGTVGFATSYFGVGVLFLDSGPIPTGDGVFHYASQGLVASVGLPVGPVGFGLRWRFFRISSPFAGAGWSVDPALLVVTDVIRIGLLYEGAFSEPVVYDGGGEEAWTKTLRLGVAVTLRPAADVLWNAAFEAVGLLSSLADFVLGIEAWIGGLGARVGYDGNGPTFGLSLRFTSLQIDWAYATRADLGDSHRISLTFRF